MQAVAGQTIRIPNLLLFIVSAGTGLPTSWMLYGVAQQSEGPNWPTVTFAGYPVSIGGVMGVVVASGTFYALLLARMIDHAQFVSSARWRWIAAGVAFLIVATCAIGGDDLTAGVLRGLLPTVACTTGLLATRQSNGVCESQTP